MAHQETGQRRGRSGFTSIAFIVGCPRSGTTALAQLLNLDSRIAMGDERFSRIADDVEPFHFTPEVFFTPIRQEATVPRAPFYRLLRRDWDEGRIRVIGDKYPPYYRIMESLIERFPDSRFIFALRDPFAVANSYESRRADPADHLWPEEWNYAEAVDQWNKSLSALRRAVENGNGHRIMIVQDPFFTSDDDRVRVLFEFLGLPLDDKVRAGYREMCNRYEERGSKRDLMNAEMRAYVAARHDAAGNRWTQATPDVARV